MTGVQLTMIVMMVYLTCLHITGVSGQQSTEAEICISRYDDIELMMKAARQEMTDVMRAARQETEELRAVLKDVSGKLEQQNAIIDGLTEKHEEQNTIIKKLELDNLEMKQFIEGQQAENEKQQVQNGGQQVQIEGQKVQIEGQKVEIEGQKVQIEKFERGQVIMAQQIEDLIAADKRHDDESQQIAFSVVSHQNFGPVTLDTNVEYEIVHTNIGGGWVPLADTFQAPVSGVYMFTASMVSYSSVTQRSIKCNIVHNTQAGQTIVASMRGKQDGSYGDANSVIIELAEDDVVSVQLVANDGDNIITSSSTNVWSTFSGFLIFI